MDQTEVSPATSLVYLMRLSILFQIGVPHMTKPYTKGLHLTIDNREFIEDALNMILTLQEMAEHIGKDKTTIKKEIKRNRIFLTRKPDQLMKACQHQSICKKQHICNNFTCDKICKSCKHKNCFSVC
jgi:IS30 family transposase